jgi:hypothetical protein
VTCPPELQRRIVGLRATVRRLLAVAAMSGAAACSIPQDPIVVDEGHVMVANLTAVEWRNVRVTVNDHFSGGVSSLAPGGRLNAPLSQFQTGLGQKFDRGRQSVFKVEVTATDADGKPVSLKWGSDRPK